MADPGNPAELLTEDPEPASDSGPTTAIVTEPGPEPKPEPEPDSLVALIRGYFRNDRSRMTMSAARTFGVPERAVIEALIGVWPIVRLREGSFRDLMEALPDLGPMRVFVRSRAAVMEVVGTFGGFSETGPFFNVQTDTLDMHILSKEVAAAFAVEKVGHDSTITTYSFQLFDHEGDAAFKIFLWDGYPDVHAHRIEAFHELTRRLAAPEPEPQAALQPPPSDRAPEETRAEPDGPVKAASTTEPPRVKAAKPDVERVPIPLPDGITPGSTAVAKKILGQRRGEAPAPSPTVPTPVRRKRLIVRGLIVLVSLVTLYFVFVGLVAPYFWYHFEEYPKLTDAPKTAQTAQNLGSDPLNVGLIGSERDVVVAILEAGWTPSDPKTFLAGNRFDRAKLEDKPFPRATFGDIYLFGRAHDLMFEKSAEGQGKRTVRLWRSSELGVGGRPLWIGVAALARVPKDPRPETPSPHHIGPNVDAERDALFADLSRVLRLTEIMQVTGFGPTLSGGTEAGDWFYTDGELLIGTLTAGDPHDRPAERVAAALPVRIKDRLMAELKSMFGDEETE